MKSVFGFGVVWPNQLSRKTLVGKTVTKVAKVVKTDKRPSHFRFICMVRPETMDKDR